MKPRISSGAACSAFSSFAGYAQDVDEPHASDDLKAAVPHARSGFSAREIGPCRKDLPDGWATRTRSQ